MAVITRWSYKRGGRKAGFHCNKFSSESLLGRICLAATPSSTCQNQTKVFMAFELSHKGISLLWLLQLSLTSSFELCD